MTEWPFTSSYVQVRASLRRGAVYAARKVTSLHDTQRDARQAAKANLEKQGGGELTTKGVNGRIVSKDTIRPGNDPNPPRDREH